MAEAKAKAGEEDLSMEEILQSIRKIIAEDGEEVTPTNGTAAAAIAAPANDSDVLELTEMMDEPEAVPALELTQEIPVSAPPAMDVLSKIDSVVMADEAPAPAPVAAAAPVAPAAPSMPEAAQPMSEKNQSYIDSLLSAEAASAVSSAFKKAHPVEPPIMTTPSPQFRSGGSVEDLVMEALKPMLKHWLDTNLPNIVERIVEREIKKLTD